MKKSDCGRLLDRNISRDEMRRQLRACGFDNFYQEIEMDSSLVDTHRDVSHTADNVVQHSHLFYEIICCTGGKLEYLVGVQRFSFQAGDIILIPPGVIHCPILTRAMSAPYKRYVVWISSAFMETLCHANRELLNFQKAAVLRTQGTKWESLQGLFLRGVEEAEAQAPGWQTCLGGNAAQLLVQIARARLELEPVLVNVRRTLLETVLEYVQNNLSEKLTVADTARHFHISQSTLTHLFHQEMGIGFYRCVMQRRLAEAKNLIAQGIPLGQVGLCVGFQEYSAFYRAFKAEFGVSPIQYRRLLAER